MFIPCIGYVSSGLEINGRGDSLRWPRDTVYSLKLALTSPTSGGRSVGIVRLLTKATESFFIGCPVLYFHEYTLQSVI
jgi:hypothetical protein